VGYRGLAGCLRLTGMTRLQDYARQLASPMELLGEVSGAREADLRRLGLPRQEVRSLLALADVYFGPTPFTRRQRSCRATKHCLATLKIIEKSSRARNPSGMRGRCALNYARTTKTWSGSRARD